MSYSSYTYDTCTIPTYMAHTPHKMVDARNLDEPLLTLRLRLSSRSYMHGTLRMETSAPHRELQMMMIR